MSGLKTLPLNLINATGNIRETSDKDLAELIASIKVQGVLEPLIVTQHGEDHRHRLVCGFRRYRAAQLAGLKEVPVVERTMNAAEIVEAQLVENLQREDLDPVDEARALQAYIDSTECRQQDVAKKIGKSQSHVAKRLALLKFSSKVQGLIRRGIISPHHAEVLAGIPAGAKDLDDGRDLVESLAELVEDQEVPAEEFKNEAVWRIGAWRQEEARMKKFAAFKPCPTCGSPPKKFLHEHKNDHDVTCDGGHCWNGNTGKAIKIDTRDRAYDYSPTPRRAVKRDATEGQTIRSFHDALSITKAMLEQVKEGDVRSIVFGSYGFNVHWTSAVKKDLSVYLVPHAYSTGEKTEVQVQAYDNRRRKEMKEAFRAWEKKSLPKVDVKKVKAKAIDAKVLDGTVAQVCSRLPSKDLETLEALRDLEAKGKARNGVLDEIDLRIRGDSR
jgi:ParB/RepB/Spo0J family partition protein